MKIKLFKDGHVWCVVFNKDSSWFENYEGATEYALKVYKRYYKEQAAYSRLCQISSNLLSVEERAFYNKLVRTRCKGITKAQYGFLTGIYERQEREW